MFLDGLHDMVAEDGGQTYYAELEADLGQRLWRNKTEHRLKHKKKADFAKTEASLLHFEENRTMNSAGHFPYPERHVKINNTHLAPEETAQQIAAALGLTSAAA